jgi:hypothetical protein
MNQNRCTGRILIPVLFLFGAFSPTFGQHPNVRISVPSATDPEEVTIAVNPANPLVLAAGANINYSFVSTDGGRSWNSHRLVSPSFGVWGDPSVLFDASGNLYYSHLSNPPAGGYWIDRIVVQKSTDNGLTFNDGAGIGYNPPLQNQDKEWLATDMTSSPYSGSMYIAWTDFDRYGSASPTDSSRILFSRSTDQGASWSSPVRVSDDAGNCVDSDSTDEGAVPAVGPQGQVYLSWSGPLGIMFDKSMDGGATWGKDIFVTAQPGGWDYMVPGIYRCNGQPVTACDAGSSPYRGTIYINWTDQRNGEDNTDVFCIRSTDQGTTWGPVVRVNNDTGAHQQFFSWMTVDQSDGAVYVVFYDRRNSAGNVTDVVLAKSIDGGVTFTNTIVSDSAFVPRSGVFFGDYTNVAAMNGIAYPVWMRLDSATSALSVWTAIVGRSARITMQTSPGWNMLSVPVRMADSTPAGVFPLSDSHVFAYGGRYVPVNSVQTGRGYWARYSDAVQQVFQGDTLLIDSVGVEHGWNMIGSLSLPLPVSSIESTPPGILVSGCFAYTPAGYTHADTILPGRGYWIKTSSGGTLILSAKGGAMSSRRIRYQSDGELPPEIPDMRLETGLPSQLSLDQNYPNPFNPVTKIRFVTGTRETGMHLVSLKIYDALGREVATLASGEMPAGEHSVIWDASGRPSGVYYCRLVTGGNSLVRAMVLMR